MIHAPRALFVFAALVVLVGCSSTPKDESSAPAEPNASATETKAAEPAFIDTFNVDVKDFTNVGRNPYFVLEPGYFLELEGVEHGEKTRLVVTVLDETKVVGGVETRVVEERESEGGELSEVSRNYFAIGKRDNAVYCFGEDVDEYEHGKVVKHGGSWRAGEKGARFGMMMPGIPELGMRWYEELAPGVAMDRAEVVSVKEPVGVEGGAPVNCLRIKETSAVEKGTEFKTYAPGIGLVDDGGMKLVKHGARDASKKGKKKKKKQAA